jgi:hypothetical protein
MTVPAIQEAREKKGMLTGLRGSRRSSGYCWLDKGRSEAVAILRRSWERRRTVLSTVEDEAVVHEKTNGGQYQMRKTKAMLCA